ncbi:hypothetical protein PINS_up011552 [Pythium insidiosum]|nr:hypothetical protein PINS_up011552 [Pythium insidiosum]
MMIDSASGSSGGSGAIGGRSLVSLFPSTEDLLTVRAALLRILRQSSSPSSTSSVAVESRRRLRLETLALLTRCLDRQPGFFAYVLFDEEETTEKEG